jgi:hypothetical protein
MFDSHYHRYLRDGNHWRRCFYNSTGAGTVAAAPGTPLESRVADMRAAIIRYWLLNMRGGEKVVEVPCRTQPEYDLFTRF